MESESKFAALVTSVTDFLNGQPWFQQIKAKWEELDPTSRLYLKLASLASLALFGVFFAVSTVWSVHKLKRDLAEKSDLLTVFQSANDELRRLKEAGTGFAAAAGASNGPWSDYFSTTAGAAGLDKANMVISDEKKGAAGDQAKESLYDITIKRANIRQIVRFAFNLENGQRPVKLRNLLIDTKDDPTGYMGATLSVSAFTLVTK